MLLVLKFVVLQKWFTYFKIVLQFLKIWNTKANLLPSYLSLSPMIICVKTIILVLLEISLRELKIFPFPSDHYGSLQVLNTQYLFFYLKLTLMNTSNRLDFKYLANQEKRRTNPWRINRSTCTCTCTCTCGSGSWWVNPTARPNISSSYSETRKIKRINNWMIVVFIFSFWNSEKNFEFCIIQIVMNDLFLVNFITKRNKGEDNEYPVFC